MNNPKSIVDIPGYYFDPMSLRYFKQDPVNLRSQIFASTHAENKLLGSAIKPQRSVINLLKKRETGFDIYSFENQTISSKFTNLNCVETKLGVNRRQACKDVEFLKGGGKSLYIEHSDEQQRYHFEEILHFFSPKNNNYSCYHYRSPLSISTVDMVEAPNRGDYLFVILTYSDTWKVLLQPRNNIIDEFNRQIVYRSREPIWCCAKNEFTSHVAFGKMNNIYLGKLSLEGYSTKSTIGVEGEVRAVEFNKQGTLLFSGHHTGHIGSIDLRTTGNVFCDKLYKIGIDETILLFDENYLICGGFDGMICKVDLRMRKPVCEYFGHVKPLRKFHLSLCEANHLLCASGSDNVTRIWNLSSGGEPLKCIKPRLDDGSCRSWLVSNGFKFYIYQFQKGDTYIYDNI